MAPAYSTDPRAADLLAARLEKQGLSVTCERAGPLWYCAFSVLVAGHRERIATGAGTTRPLALCRAVLNLPRGGSLAGF